jgi:hypothetical protein
MIESAGNLDEPKSRRHGMMESYREPGQEGAPMKFTERFEIGQPLGQETRLLRASTYNRAQLLLARGGDQALFVPIRPMQYLAVIEAREFIFVDGLGSRVVELLWRDFRPSARQRLDDPVPFQLQYFRPGALEQMRRLQVEFARALELLDSRQIPAGGAEVVTFRRKR